MTTEPQRRQLWTGSSTSEPVESHVASQVVVYTHEGPNKTSGNEDAASIAVLDNTSGVLCVVDGMGGALAGERAAAIAVESVSEAVLDADAGKKLRALILDGIEEANRKVLDLKLGAGCTLAAVEFQPGMIRPYHVGDAAILVFGQRGKVKLATVAHSPVGMAVESGMLDDQDAMHHEDRHIISNAIGLDEMRIEIGPPIQLAARDTVLLASDGLLDNMHTQEIIDIVRKGKLLPAVTRLVDTARLRMTNPEVGVPSKPDDLTVIAYRPSA